MFRKNLVKINAIILSTIIFAFIFGCSRKNDVPQNVVPPFISDVQVINITTSQATVTWLTLEPATSQVDYGLDTNYYEGVFNSKAVSDHSVILRDLFSGKTYHFQIQSVDTKGKLVTDIDRTFTTLAQ